MELGTAGLELIKEFEKFSPTIYRDQALLPTIGWGHRLTKQEIASGTYRSGVSDSEALRLLKDDCAWAVLVVNKRVKRALTQSQFDALVAFVFNIGSGNFAHSTVLKKVNAGEWDAVPAAMAMWNKVRSKGGRVESNGLKRRRAAEASLFPMEGFVQPQPQPSLSSSGINTSSPPRGEPSHEALLNAGERNRGAAMTEKSTNSSDKPASSGKGDVTVTHDILP